MPSANLDTIETTIVNIHNETLQKTDEALSKSFLDTLVRLTRISLQELLVKKTLTL